MAGTAGISDRDRVLDATDLVALIGEHVQLRPKGREHVGLCPFHDDRTPSLAVVTHKGSGFYKCFSCGAAGNAIDFMMNFHKMEFIDALRALAERAGIELRQTRSEDAAGGGRRALLRANAAAATYFRRVLAHPEAGAAARAALDARGISAEMRERFGLGAAPDSWDGFVRHLERLRAHLGGAAARGEDALPEPDAFRAAGLVRDGRQGPIDGFRNRVIFPICDELGAPIAFGARQIDPQDQPKYLNSPESGVFHKGRGLYGLHLAKKSILEKKEVIICEGYTDVIACHEAGVTNAVATLGTALTRDHARMLKRLCDRIVLLFDGDAAGQKAADRAVEVFFSEPVDVRICTLPDELDPDELLHQEGGRARFDTALEASEDALHYLGKRFREEFKRSHGLSSEQQRLEALLSKLAELGFQNLTGLRREMLLRRIDSIAGIEVRKIEEAFATFAKRAPGSRGARQAESVDRGDELAPAPLRAPTLEEQGFAPPAARARREAERGLVALLVAHPELGRERVALEDGCSLPLAEALTPEALLDPPTRAVYEALHPWLESTEPCPAETLLAEVHDPQARSLAADLLMLGAARASSGNAALELLRDAFAAFERIRRPKRAEPSSLASGSDPAAFTARLEQIRARGLDPTAIGRRDRGAGISSRQGPPTTRGASTGASGTT
ncbi:MAG: DNA primase [Phycisphaerales bacterium]